MKAGQLNQRVTLERLVEGQDAAGQPIESWAPLFTCWAAVKPLRGREIIAADAVAAISDVRVILRYRTGTNTAMRIRHGQDTYQIESIANVNSANREIELLCKRVA